MFTLPPLPPKDYILKDVNQNQRSVQEHTPDRLPTRITQSNLAKFLSPIEYQGKEKLNDVKFDEVNPQILERWADKERAFWVEKPGKDDFFLHDMCKKYSVEVEDSYDTRFRHKAEHVFYRSYMYELDCLEHVRLQKLHRKSEREFNEEQSKFDGIEARRNAIKQKRQAIDLGIMPCKPQPPVWWKEKKPEADDFAVPPLEEFIENLRKSKEQSTYKQHFKRWQDEPNFLQNFKGDPCQRRRDMALIGQPFQSEACNWYYENYPPPNISSHTKKFS